MALRVAFFGTPAFAVPTLEHLMNSAHTLAGVITQPDKPRGRGQQITDGPVKSLATSFKLPVLQPAKLAREQFEPAFAALGADIGVVAAYGKILPDWLLATPRFGLINVHASLLPRYRGASPVHRAVVNGDAETGVTIMRVVKALDAGPMLAAVRVPIGIDDTTTIVESVLAARGAELLLATLDAIEAGTAHETPQDEALVTYAPKLSKNEGMVDWSLPGPRIHNLIRGLWPWPHAYSYLGAIRHILHRSRLSSRPTHNAAPGTILQASPVDGLHVACGDATALELLDIQLEGKRVMSARDAMAAKTLVAGARFAAMIATARRAAADALAVIDAGEFDMGSAIARVRATLTDDRDRALLLEIVSGTLRMQAALDHQLSLRVNRPLGRLDAAVLRVLRMSAFQLIYLSRQPASAVINDAVELTRRSGKSSAAGLTNAVLRSLSRERESLQWPSRDDLGLHLSVVHSHPRWLVDRWLMRHGTESTEAWLIFNNTPAAMCLAVNRHVTTREDLASELASAGVTTQPTERALYGLRVIDGRPLSTAAFTDGRFLVQDEASQLIAELVSPGTGAIALDLCASPGGKTLAISAAIGSTGVVIASDVRPQRVRLLASTLARCRVPNAKVVHIPADGPLPFATETFDFVLIDAPCSGLGTVRRDPDIRWRRSPDDLPRFAAAQRDLLGRASDLVKPGGRLLYSTCSSEPEENEEVVTTFLSSRTDFSQEHTHQTLPFRDRLEAFFGSVLRRTSVERP